MLLMYKLCAESRYTSKVINIKFKDFIIKKQHDLEKDVNREDTVLVFSAQYFLQLTIKLFEFPTLGIRIMPN